MVDKVFILVISFGLIVLGVFGVWVMGKLILKVFFCVW